MFRLDTLVVREYIGDINAGKPFLENNNIAVHPAKKEIIIKGCDIVNYASISFDIPPCVAYRLFYVVLRATL